MQGLERDSEQFPLLVVFFRPLAVLNRIDPANIAHRLTILISFAYY